MGRIGRRTLAPARSQRSAGEGTFARHGAPVSIGQQVTPSPAIDIKLTESSAIFSRDVTQEIAQ